MKKADSLIEDGNDDEVDGIKTKTSMKFNI